ncbi:MAG TPA: nucleotide exchange factor GrpE [Cellvibrionaceae bacterium]|nr:nucleotide exchange factor GrpE [Cellvibrionaceae bacterium]
MSQDPTSTQPSEDQVEFSFASSSASSSAGGAYASASSSGGGAAAAASGPLTFELEAEIERLKDELMQTKEQSLRAMAEAQNIRRRAEQDVEKAHKFGLEKFMSDLLPVADNLERSIEAAASSSDLKTLMEGVEMTLKTLLSSLGKQQLVAVNPVGEPFDPQLHQAMTAVPNADCEPNTVLNVFQKGYTLHGRLLRPAMVVVSKKPE